LTHSLKATWFQTLAPFEYRSWFQNAPFTFNLRRLQYGVCTFAYNPDTRAWTCRPFNFWVFPDAKGGDGIFGCQASSMAFLAENGEGAVQVESIHLTHGLKAAWFQPLSLSSEKLVSSPPLRYNEMQLVPLRDGFDFNKCIRKGLPYVAAADKARVVGLCRLNQVDP
jgi:hypothetical protein